MKYDLFILDDLDDVRDVLTANANLLGVSSIAFASGIEALEYLRSCEPGKLPGTYLVDMRIPGSQEELDSSEEISKYIHAQGPERFSGFYFMTGNISNHDLKVAAQTGAPIIQKNTENLPRLVEIIKNSKSS